MDATTERYGQILRDYLRAEYPGMFRPAGEVLKYPFLAPGSRSYADVLWDWDSWLSNVALRQILAEAGDQAQSDQAVAYERGCVKNFLAFGSLEGWLPIQIRQNRPPTRPSDLYAQNMHKPVLAQHAAFLVRQAGGDAEWLRENEGFYFLQAFVNNYRNHHRHRPTGLYFWQNDWAVGVDNDPCTFFRPPRSSGSIYLNCLMYKELQALAYLGECLNQHELAGQYRADADELHQAIQRHCWDERDGFFYSVDLNLLPIDHSKWAHSGQPRDWDCLIQRIGVWSGFLALWAGLAEPEQARRVVEQHYRDERTFHAPFGVRTLSKMEKMYNLRASGNPSSWLGPIWGVSNYLTFRGLVRYGFTDDARDLAVKTVQLFGRDIERFGAMHEYYQPESGEPTLNRGFQNWNCLALNMLVWLEGNEPVTEF